MKTLSIIGIILTGLLVLSLTYKPTYHDQVINKECYILDHKIITTKYLYYSLILITKEEGYILHKDVTPVTYYKATEAKQRNQTLTFKISESEQDTINKKDIPWYLKRKDRISTSLLLFIGIILLVIASMFLANKAIKFLDL